MDWKIWGGVLVFSLLVGVVAWGVHLQRAAEHPATLCVVQGEGPHFEIQILGASNATNITWSLRVVNPTNSNFTYEENAWFSRLLEEIPNFGLHTLETTARFAIAGPLVTIAPNGTSGWSSPWTFDPARSGARSTHFVIEATQGTLCGIASTRV